MMDKYDSNKTYSTGTVARTTPQKLDLAVLMEIIKKLTPKTLLILKTGNSLFKLEEKPKFMLSKYVADNMAYIVADFGIVAGKYAYEQIKTLNLELRWTTDVKEAQIDNDKYSQRNFKS